jgi:hypothetical protein
VYGRGRRVSCIDDNHVVHAAADDHRPVALIFVYTWDVVRALLALAAALAPFGGAVAIGAREIAIPLWQQLLYATSAASYGAALFVVGVLLPRRAAWVRRAQITLFALSATLATGSLALQMALPPHDLQPEAVVLTLLFVLLYVAGIAAMLGDRVAAYLRGPGRTPGYLIALVAYWCCAQAALTVLHAAG